MAILFLRIYLKETTIDMNKEFAIKMFNGIIYIIENLKLLIKQKM